MEGKIMLNEQTTRGLVQQGVESNIVAYDHDAGQGRFTTRLIHIANQVLMTNFDSTLAILYVSNDAIVEDRQVLVEVLRAYNAGIVFTPHLMHEKIGEYFSKTLNSSRASGDLDLVIVTAKDGHVILASY
jgi:hypothetical protein